MTIYTSVIGEVTVKAKIVFFTALLLLAGCQSWGKFWDVTPRLLSVYPADSATSVSPCSGSPCRARVELVFSQSMNTQSTPSMTMEIYDGSAFVALAAPSSANWSTTTLANDTLTFYWAWYWFPANSRLRYVINAADLKSASGIAPTLATQGTFTTTASVHQLVISDTGQTNCRDAAGSALGCPQGTHPGQDADFTNTPAARSYTGPSAHATFTGDYTTRDNTSGLTWKSCHEGLSGATCLSGTSATHTWLSAMNQCAALNSANSGNGYAGLTSWRLPTTGELETLHHGQNIAPAITGGNFPATSNTPYWTQDTMQNNIANGAWVHFNLAHSMSPGISSLAKTSTYNVRCVASPATPAKVAFTDNGDGTISDAVTGLRWQKCSRGQNNDSTCSGAALTGDWQSALVYCDGLTLGSFGNASAWRLPSFSEFRSIIDRSRMNPAIDTAKFPATVANYYWSSSTNTASGLNAWIIDFTLGASEEVGKAGSHATRCVATGP